MRNAKLRNGKLRIQSAKISCEIMVKCEMKNAKLKCERQQPSESTQLNQAWIHQLIKESQFSVVHKFKSQNCNSELIVLPPLRSTTMHLLFSHFTRPVAKRCWGKLQKILITFRNRFRSLPVSQFRVLHFADFPLPNAYICLLTFLKWWSHLECIHCLQRQFHHSTYSTPGKPCWQM